MNINIGKAFKFVSKLAVWNQAHFYSGIKFKYDIYKDYYKVLGLSKQANSSQIKRQYYKLAKMYHPDVNHDAHQLIKQINQAYTVLSDQKVKKMYDQQKRNQDVKIKQKDKEKNKEKQAFRYSKNNQSSDKNYNRTSHEQYAEHQKEYSAQNQQKMSNQQLNQHIKKLVFLLVNFTFISANVTLLLSYIISPKVVDQYGNSINFPKDQPIYIFKQTKNNQKNNQKHQEKNEQRQQRKTINRHFALKDIKDNNAYSCLQRQLSESKF